MCVCIYIYICIEEEFCVEALAYCDGTYWSLVPDICLYIYIFVYKGAALRRLLNATVRIVR